MQPDNVIIHLCLEVSLEVQGCTPRYKLVGVGRCLSKSLREIDVTHLRGEEEERITSASERDGETCFPL